MAVRLTLSFSHRKQKGTEIVDGRKDHVNRLVMHYVEAPDIISTTDYGNNIDERTQKTEIWAKEAARKMLSQTLLLDSLEQKNLKRLLFEF